VKRYINFWKPFSQKWRRFFPDEYLHIGGDENEGHQWSKNEQIQAFMKAKA
jgi:hexosaminidase